MIDAPNARNYLQAIVRLSKESNLRCPVQEYLLEHGKAYEWVPCPREIKLGTQKECFANAWRLAYHRGLRYVEGIGDHLISTWHAWNLDADGRVIDNTWRPRKDTVPREYFGVEIPLDVVNRVMARTRKYGVLFTPEYFEAIGKTLEKQVEPAAVAPEGGREQP